MGRLTTVAVHVNTGEPVTDPGNWTTLPAGTDEDTLDEGVAAQLDDSAFAADAAEDIGYLAAQREDADAAKAARDAAADAVAAIAYENKADLPAFTPEEAAAPEPVGYVAGVSDLVVADNPLAQSEFTEDELNAMTKAELLEVAEMLDIEGRDDMLKAELLAAILAVLYPPEP